MLLKVSRQCENAPGKQKISMHSTDFIFGVFLLGQLCVKILYTSALPLLDWKKCVDFEPSSATFGFFCVCGSLFRIVLCQLSRCASPPPPPS